MNSTTTLTASAEIVSQAMRQHTERLLSAHPNIVSISNAVKNTNEHVVTIYLEDHNTFSIPKTLTVFAEDGSECVIETEIVSGLGKATLQWGQKTTRISASSSPEYYGSMCCLVKSTTDPDFIGIVTSGHVMTKGKFSDYGGMIPEDEADTALLNDDPGAQWHFQLMEYDQDLAIARISDKEAAMQDYISFAQGFYPIQDSDIKTPQPNVTVVSRNNNTRDAFILDQHISLEVDYDTPQLMRNLILIGTDDNRNESQTISKEGDSGSCVFHKKTGKLIGMLLGGNEKFSFVLPLEQTLNDNNFKLV